MLLLIVRTGSEVGVDEHGCSPTRAQRRCTCRTSQTRPAATTPATQSQQRRAAGVADHIAAAFVSARVRGGSAVVVSPRAGDGQVIAQARVGAEHVGGGVVP